MGEQRKRMRKLLGRALHRDVARGWAAWLELLEATARLTRVAR